LGSAGIPAEGIIIIIGVERLLGMFRTAVNVTGDLTACVVFNQWYGTVMRQAVIAPKTVEVINE
jgi:Na+/H+-dicarboxylate symporter